MIDPKNLLQSTLTLEQIGPFEYKAQSFNPGWNRIYGGQIIAQSMLASSKTVTDKNCHSIHSYFMRPGDPEKPVTFHVNPIRDGRSFATRTLEAFQGEEAIFTMSASYHKDEPGFDHHDPMGEVKMPDELESITDIIKKMGDQLPKPVTAYFNRERPFEMRPINISRYLNPVPGIPEQSFWLRATSEVADELPLQQAALGYASDFTLLDTALIAHGKLLFDPNIMVASLDHSIWFHRPFKINQWLLYKQKSSNAMGARALTQGQFFNLEGTLVASTTQEGLVRPITSPKGIPTAR